VTVAVLTAAAALVTACLGTYVAALAYRGYRRNDSATMRLLAVGVAFVAVVPYVVTYAVSPAVGLSDAGTILGVTLSHLVGLAALARSVA